MSRDLPQGGTGETDSAPELDTKPPPEGRHQQDFTALHTPPVDGAQSRMTSNESWQRSSQCPWVLHRAPGLLPAEAQGSRSRRIGTACVPSSSSWEAAGCVGVCQPQRRASPNIAFCTPVAPGGACSTQGDFETDSSCCSSLPKLLIQRCQNVLAVLRAPQLDFPLLEL